MTRKLIPLVLVCAAGLSAASDDSKAILELGGATAVNLSGESSGGGDLAVEFGLVERWLEVELGTAPVFSRGTKEWDTDLLFKKPWTLSERVEFMAGMGPAWVHTRQGRLTTNSAAVELVADFMFWPSAKHRFGWFIEPGYEYSLGRGHEKSFGVSAGLLIAIR